MRGRISGIFGAIQGSNASEAGYTGDYDAETANWASEGAASGAMPVIAAALAILSIISGLVIIASAIFNRDTLFHYKADTSFFAYTVGAMITGAIAVTISSGLHSGSAACVVEGFLFQWAWVATICWNLAALHSWLLDEHLRYLDGGVPASKLRAGAKCMLCYLHDCDHPCFDNDDADDSDMDSNDALWRERSLPRMGSYGHSAGAPLLQSGSSSDEEAYQGSPPTRRVQHKGSYVAPRPRADYDPALAAIETRRGADLCTIRHTIYHAFGWGVPTVMAIVLVALNAVGPIVAESSVWCWARRSDLVVRGIFMTAPQLIFLVTSLTWTIHSYCAFYDFCVSFCLCQVSQERLAPTPVLVGGAVAVIWTIEFFAVDVPTGAFTKEQYAVYAAVEIALTAAQAFVTVIGAAAALYADGQRGDDHGDGDDFGGYPADGYSDVEIAGNVHDIHTGADAESDSDLSDVDTGIGGHDNNNHVPSLAGASAPGPDSGRAEAVRLRREASEPWFGQRRSSTRSSRPWLHRRQSSESQAQRHSLRMQPAGPHDAPMHPIPPTGGLGPRRETSTSQYTAFAQGEVVVGGYATYEYAKEGFHGKERDVDPYDCSQFPLGKRIMVMVLFMVLLCNRGCIALVEGVVQADAGAMVSSPMFLNSLRSAIAAVLFLVFAGALRCAFVLRSDRFWRWVYHTAGSKLSYEAKGGETASQEEAARLAKRPWFDPLLCCTVPKSSGSVFVEPRKLPRDPVGQPMKGNGVNWRFVDQQTRLCPSAGFVLRSMLVGLIQNHIPVTLLAFSNLINGADTDSIPPVTFSLVPLVTFALKVLWLRDTKNVSFSNTASGLFLSILGSFLILCPSVLGFNGPQKVTAQQQIGATAFGAVCATLFALSAILNKQLISNPSDERSAGTLHPRSVQIGKAFNVAAVGGVLLMVVSGLGAAFASDRDKQLMYGIVVPGPDQHPAMHWGVLVAAGAMFFMSVIVSFILLDAIGPLNFSLIWSTVSSVSFVIDIPKNIQAGQQAPSWIIQCTGVVLVVAAMGYAMSGTVPPSTSGGGTDQPFDQTANDSHRVTGPSRRSRRQPGHGPSPPRSTRGNSLAHRRSAQLGNLVRQGSKRSSQGSVRFADDSRRDSGPSSLHRVWQLSNGQGSEALIPQPGTVDGRTDPRSSGGEPLLLGHREASGDPIDGSDYGGIMRDRSTSVGVQQQERGGRSWGVARAGNRRSVGDVGRGGMLLASLARHQQTTGGRGEEGPDGASFAMDSRSELDPETAWSQAQPSKSGMERSIELQGGGSAPSSQQGQARRNQDGSGDARGAALQPEQDKGGETGTGGYVMAATHSDAADEGEAGDEAKVGAAIGSSPYPRTG